MTYDDMFDYIIEHNDVTQFNNADDLIQKAKMDWMEQGLEFPGGNAEDAIRERFMEYQQSLPYSDPEAYQRLQEKMAQDQLVADMLGNGQIARGYSEDIIADMNRPEVMGIDLSNVVPQKPEPTTAQQAMSGGAVGMFSGFRTGAKSIGERLQFGLKKTRDTFGSLGRLFGRRKR